MPTFVQILDFIGTFAFAISGIRLASAKRFDWFGAYVVGLATAIGGGTIRDVLLDVTPGWMTDPIYLICTGLALLWVICFGRWLIRLNNTFFIFDTIGLALFTVVGVGKSIALGYPFWVAIIMGSITGAAGGVIRDVFINEIPLIFRKEIYAMACVVGGIAYWILRSRRYGVLRLSVDWRISRISDSHLSCKISHLPAYIKRWGRAGRIKKILPE